LALPPLSQPLAQTLGGSGAASGLELVISAALVLLVLLVVARWGVPEPRWARRWLYLQPAAAILVVRPLMGLAHALARFDDRVLDPGVDTMTRGVDVAGKKAAAIDDLRVDGFVEAIATGVRRLGRLARTPQTGAVHQYMMQAVVVITVGIVAFSIYALIG